MCGSEKKHHKTVSFSSNPRFWSSDLNTRMISASLPNMFTRLRELTGSGPFSVQFTIGAEWNVRQWSEHHKTASFHQICDSGIMACFDYSTSAVVRVRASSPAWRYYYNVRFNLWRYHYNVGFNSTDFRWVCYSEGPGEQPGMTTLNEIVNENTWTGVVS